MWFLEKMKGMKFFMELQLSEMLLIYLIVVNIIGFLIMLIDKKKAEKGKWRIQEKTIFIVTLLGGGIGTISGMYIFRHKTKKLQFTVGLPVITILEILGIIYFWWIFK